MKELNFRIKLILLSPILFISLIAVTKAQMMSNTDKIVLDNEQKREAIDSIANLIIDNYVFPDFADQMAKMLKNNFAKGAYDSITDPNLFAQVIGSDLHKINDDKHLRVRFDPRTVRDIRSMTKDSMSQMEKRMHEMMKYDNYGFYKVERLKGNIGYLDFRGFADVKSAGETAAAALAFLSNCDALIIDLRQNHGGEPDMIRFICSYFFGPDSVHLNDIYYRKTGETEQYWTHKDIKGKRMTDVDIYVLTSKNTFSGAEEFTYDLKNLKRATIIGEVTGGGANPGAIMAANENFVVFVPTGRAINPYTKTNWEGVGVKPDIEVPSEKALNVALVEATKKLLSKTNDKNKISQLEWQLVDLEAQVNPYSPDETTMAKYAGDYGERHISFENGNLYYERINVTPKMKMIPLKEDMFKVENINYFRMKFIRDENRNIISIEGLYDDGMTDSSPKTN